jgi:hypothetical protein
MNFGQDYDSITDQINSIVSVQSSDSTWNSIAGGLDKVSTSSMGFAWGIGGGDIYVCQLPCNGQWKKVDSGAIDITTDDSYVYVLTPTTMKFKSASNVDNWIEVKTPNLTSIVCTGSYIWGQSNGKTYRLAKPGTTGNWILVQNINTITSASGNSLYGIDITGNAIKTDEAMQSGWSIIPDFIGSKLTKVIGDIDQTALYGIDTTNQLKRCISGNCQPVSTDGYNPKSLSIDPVTKTLWMTTQTSGTDGNIFTKLDSMENIIPAVQPLDNERDQIVNKTKVEYNQSTHSNIMSKQVKTVVEFIKNFFNSNTRTNKLIDNKHLSEKVERLHNESQQLQSSLPTIQSIVFYIASAAMVYIFLSILGDLTHIIALGILGYGIYDLYFLRSNL